MKRFIIPIAFIFAIIYAWTSRPVEAASAATLTLGKTVVGEGVDFATRVIGDPWWNMNGNPYPDTFTALKNINTAQFKITNDGFWEMKSINSDPIIWLHWTGVGTTQHVLKMGDTLPIDASKYKLLSYYMCLDQAPAPNDFDWAATVYWMYDRMPHDDPNNGFTNFLLFVNQGRFKNDGDCELITFDLSQSSTWQKGSWNNNPQQPIGLRLDPINKSGASYKIGWVRLTTKDTNNIVPLNWSNAPAGEHQFYVSLTGCGQNGILIGKKSGTSGTFNWGQQVIPGFSSSHPLPLPESFEPDTYFLYMKDANGATACASNNPLKISAAPTLAFQKPSFQSGPDFALNVVGDQWGMSNKEDIEEMVSVTTSNFSNGLLTLTAEDMDPRLFMNLNDHKVPTSQYFYVTFRFQIDGTREAGSGWVQRWLWWYDAGPSFAITSQDMEVYQGWHEYTLDLRTAPTENCNNNCWSGMPRVFRFDPFEVPKPTEILLDYVLLTGPESVTKGSIFPIYFTTTASENATVRFYYDSDTNPSNGRTLIGSMVLGPSAVPEVFDFNSFKLFLPTILNRNLEEVKLYENSLQFDWNTSNVPKNTFYVSAEVDDGVNVTTWYSEIPVTIK